MSIKDERKKQLGLHILPISIYPWKRQDNSKTREKKLQHNLLQGINILTSSRLLAGRTMKEMVSHLWEGWYGK
jgi:hypothetical protein